MSSEPSPGTLDVRNCAFWMTLSVANREYVPRLYLFKRFATDPACASDTPSMPTEWNNVNGRLA